MKVWAPIWGLLLLMYIGDIDRNNVGFHTVPISFLSLLEGIGFNKISIAVYPHKACGVASCTGLIAVDLFVLYIEIKELTPILNLLLFALSDLKYQENRVPDRQLLVIYMGDIN